MQLSRHAVPTLPSEMAADSLREAVVLEHPGDGLRQGGADGGRDGFLGIDGAMQVAELAFGVGVATRGLEPALEDGRGAGPFGPVAVGAVGGLDQMAERATAEEAFDRGGVFRADGRDELLAFARFHLQVL
jgi:hypothetical protein